MYDKFRNYMTTEMIDEVNTMAGLIYEEIEVCIERANACATATDIRLPATAASGQAVVAGARNVVDSMLNYWVIRLRAAGKLLPVDEFRAILESHTIHTSVDHILGWV